MPQFTPHYCKGRLPVAFVFSAPGTEEVNRGRPVSGATGDNLEHALGHLSILAPQVFPSSHRYDYRITNAFAQPLAQDLGNGRTEATRAEILESTNVRRFLGDVEGCQLVILCGKKARLLFTMLEGTLPLVVQVAHIGNKGLNGCFPLLGNWRLSSPADRRQERVRLWANDLVRKISKCPGFTLTTNS
jgi:uracil-DNA glycosylase